MATHKSLSASSSSSSSDSESSSSSSGAESSHSSSALAKKSLAFPDFKVPQYNEKWKERKSFARSLSVNSTENHRGLRVFCLTPTTGRIPELGNEVKPFKTSLARKVLELEESEGRTRDSLALLQLLGCSRGNKDEWNRCRRLRTVLVLSQLGYRNLQQFVKSDKCKRVEADFEQLRNDQNVDLGVLPFFEDILSYPKSSQKLVFATIMQRRAGGFHLASILGYVNEGWTGRLAGFTDRMFVPVRALRALAEANPEEETLDRFVATDWSLLVDGLEILSNTSPTHTGGSAAEDFQPQDLPLPVVPLQPAQVPEALPEAPAAAKAQPVPEKSKKDHSNVAAVQAVSRTAVVAASPLAMTMSLTTPQFAPRSVAVRQRTLSGNCSFDTLKTNFEN